MVSNIMSFKVVGIFERAKSQCGKSTHAQEVHLFSGAPHERFETWEEEQLCFQLRGRACMMNVGRKLKRAQLCGDFLMSHHEFPRACKAWAHRMRMSWELVSLGRDS